MLVLLNVTSEGCPPLEQVRFTVNDTFIIGRHNDSFRFESLTSGESYTVRVETQVKGEGFSLYKEIPVHIYDEPDTDGMCYTYVNVLCKLEINLNFSYVDGEVAVSTEQCKKLIRI